MLVIAGKSCRRLPPLMCPVPMASAVAMLLLYFGLQTILIPNFCTGSFPGNVTSRSKLVGLSFESDVDKSNQKQYVELLNAKLLAHGKDLIERNGLPGIVEGLQDPERSRIRHESFWENPGKSIASHLRQISNSELGVTAMQEIYDSLPSVTVKEETTEILKELSRKLSKKISNYLALHEQNRLYFEENLKKEKYISHSSSLACCDLPSDVLIYDDHYGIDVTKREVCYSQLYANSSDAFNVGSMLMPVFHRNLESYPSLLWQYYISLNGTHFEYPAYIADTSLDCKVTSDRHRNVFQLTVAAPKLVIIVIEQGYSLSAPQFQIAKSVAKHVLSLLTSEDQVAVFGLAGDVQYSFRNACHSHKILFATPETKLLLSKFIDSLDRKQNITNHVLGFQKIFKIISGFEQNSSSLYGEVLIAYISRGLLSSLVDAKQVLEIIADGNRDSRSSIVINTYAIIDDKPVMLETAFLKDVSEQNFKNYNVHFKSKHKIKKGVMVLINSTENLSQTIGNIHSTLVQVAKKRPFMSLPYWDSVSKGIIISLTQQVFHKNQLMGVLGIDVSLADIAEDCLPYFSYRNFHYVFVFDRSGITLMHPLFSHPSFTNDHYTHTYIWHLEDKEGFKDLYNIMIHEPSGEKYLSYNSSMQSSEQENNREILYKWRNIEGTDYIICMMSREPVKSRKILKDTVVPEVVNFMYHRLDLLPSSNICRHMKQLSSLGTTALFLSASCFISPYKYLVEEETKQMVQNYMAYLTDSTKLIANPGLKAGIRSEVLAASWITPTWEKAAQSDEFSNYIVRRFIATTSGVFQVYPATLIDKLYDPTRRDWYIQAIDHPGKIILTAPYLDIGGAGYVVTLSHTIYEGKPAALHNSQDNVAAVMGMDFSFGYFYKLLLDNVAVCKDEKIICFLLDDRGYLIAHPDLIEASGTGPVEQQHITHKERLVANDLLNRKEFVIKKVCNSFSDRTIQRYYQLNNSLQGVLTNQVQGEHCTKYQVMAIRDTNIFLGIVNRTCDGITAFCPCSMTNRLCLNCHRMEPTECECPCECSLEMNLCNGQLINENKRYATCVQFPEEPHLPLVDNVLLESLQPCYEYHCSERTDLNDCFGVLGCEWCQLEADGITPLLNKFCTDQRKCFGGVLGARTPYADEIIEGMPSEQFIIFKSPVGPVAGGFMVFFLIIALAIYCYRNHFRRGLMSHHSISLPDTNLRMAHLNNEPDEPEIFQEPIHPINPACQLIPQAENIVVSPYRVHTNYRRPPGGDSDHGYSTMTPHEDSEHTPYFEPLLIGKDKYFGPASQQSLSSCSRTSSPTTHFPQTAPPLTYIPPMNKTEIGVPPWVSKREPMQTIIQDSPLRTSLVLAQVEVHSENRA